MRQEETYTQEEIDFNLDKLKNQELDLINKRKDIDKQIKEKRDNIKYYEELSLKQYIIF